MGFLTPKMPEQAPITIESESGPIPEPSSATALRRALAVTRRKTLGGRHTTILGEGRPPAPPPAPDPLAGGPSAAPLAPPPLPMLSPGARRGGGGTVLGGGRG